MRKSKSILLIMTSTLLLAGCNETTSIRPQSSDDTATTSASIINPTSIISSLSAGIGSFELQEVIDTAKLVVNKVKTASSDYAKIYYSYPDGIKEKATIKAYSIVVKDKLYDNSVRIKSYNSTSKENSEAFGFANEDGSYIAQYTYIDNTFEHIETNLVTQKENVAVTNVKIAAELPYSLTNYDACFTVLTESTIVDVTGHEDLVELAGILDSGDVYVRFKLAEVEIFNDEYQMNEVEHSSCEFFYKNSNLSKMNIIYENYLVDDQSLIYPLQNSSVSTTYSVTTNGSYDKSSIPQPLKV